MNNKIDKQGESSAVLWSLAGIIAGQRIQAEMLCRLLAKDDDEKYDKFTSTYAQSVESVALETYNSFFETFGHDDDDAPKES